MPFYLNLGLIIGLALVLGLFISTFDPATFANQFSVFRFLAGLALGLVVPIAFVLARGRGAQSPSGTRGTSSGGGLGGLLKRKPKQSAQWEITSAGEKQLMRAGEPGATDPATIIIPNNLAVIFEDKTGKMTHVEFGPRQAQLKSEDAKEKILATRPRFKRLTLARVITCDGLPIETTEFSILYQLKKDNHLGPTANIQHPVAQDTVLKAAYAVPLWSDGKQDAVDDWELAVQEMAKIKLRAQLEKTPLAEMFDNSDRTSSFQTISDQAKRDLIKEVEAWGAEVQSLQITHAIIAPHLQRKLEERWQAKRSEEIKRAEGIAEANKIAKVEAAKAQAWKEMLETLEQFFKDKPGASLATTQYIQRMQYLDSLVRMAETGQIRVVTSFPPDAESWFNQQERPWEDATKDAKPRIIGGEPKEDQSIDKNDSSDQAATEA